jgi:hypothetical protein
MTTMRFIAPTFPFIGSVGVLTLGLHFHDLATQILGGFLLLVGFIFMVTNLPER